MSKRAKIIRTLITASIVGSVVLSAACADIRVKVRKTPQGPMLFVNGYPTAPTVFFVNVGAAQSSKYRQIRLDSIAAAAKRGVNLVSLGVVMPWKQDGVETSFAVTDGLIDDVLAVNPNALIIPRFGVTSPPQWWIDEHTDEMMLYDSGRRGTMASVHSRVWRRAAAENVGALVKHLEEKYGDHMLGYHTFGQNSGEWFYDRVVQGWLASFEPPTLDAFRAYLKDKYRTETALQRAWHSPGTTFAGVKLPTSTQRRRCKAGQFRDPVLEQKTIDYFEFENHDMATAVEDLCKVVRSSAPDKIAVQFYGYPFELARLSLGPQISGHLAMSYLLKSPHVDVMCSPVSYQNRGPGGGGFFMTTVDSVQAHGKLWLVEDDTRTCYSEEDAGYGRCSTFAETTGVLSRNFANYVTRGAAVWWMDLPGKGWFQGDELWSFLGALQGVYQTALPKFNAYRAEIAVILDEKSLLYLELQRNVSAPLLAAFREQWYRIGTPTGIYLMDDLVAGRVPSAKMYIMLNAFSLDGRQIEGIRKNACSKGSTVVWMYAPGIVRDGVLKPGSVQESAGILLSETGAGTGEIVVESTGKQFSAGHDKLSPMFAVSDKDVRVMARYVDGGRVAVASKDMGGWTSVYCGVLQLPSSMLRDLARECGVHIYCDSNDLITAGNGLVGIHASSDGHKTLNMPNECELLDALTGAKLGTGKSFEFDMKLGDTRLLRIVR